MAVHADGGDLTVVNSSIQGDLGVGGPGSVVLRGNTIAGEIGIRDADAVLEDNTVRAGPLAGSGVTVRGDSEVTLAQNDIQVRGRGIFLDGAGVRGTVASNVVTGSQAGLYLEEGVVVTAEGNRFVDNDMGIRSLSASTSFLVNNTVEDNGAGIVLSAGSTEVRENRIIDNRNQGIGVLGDASPVITDNELCGNGTDLFVAETATADTSGNEICPIEGTQSLPARTIIVDPSGNGDAATVNEGITLAAAGDIVLLRPGEYVEDVVVDKAITLRGDGSGQAVIRFTLDSPFTDTLLGFEVDRFLGPARRGEGGATDAPQSRGILIQADGSVLEDLAIAGPGSGLALRVRADGVTISGLETTFESDFGDELAEFRRQVMAVFADGGDITIVDSALQGDLLLGGPGEVTLRGNTIAGEVGIRDAEAVLEDNTIRVGLMGGSGVTVRGDTDATLMQNDIQTDDRAIFLDGVGVQATITNNVLAASTTGLYLDEGATATAEQNTFANNDIGIRSTSAGTSSLRDNTIEGNGAGVILSAGSTEVRDNRVIGNRNQGIGVLGDASPVVADNELCGNGTDLFVAETASADTSGNEICPGTE
ncbi:MAG: right-handed parallel beta-helix repeat-containing protein [Candidatus Limnocylindrales bacterium]